MIIKMQRTTGIVQQIDYEYDYIGNVSKHWDKVLDIEDRFRYDSINRLMASEVKDHVHGNKITMREYHYDELGNITNKLEVGNYTYDQTNLPHAVRSITPAKPTDQTETDSFLYDEAGEQTHADMKTADGHIIRDITYTSFEVPKMITQSNDKTNTHAQVNFYYDANHNRFMREDVISVNGQNSKTTTLYLGSEEVDTTIDSNGAYTTTKNQVGDTLLINHDDGTHQRYEILKDAIGSTNVITDEQGNAVQRFHYSPFGEQQLVSAPSSKKNVILAKAGIQENNDERTSITRYGFTGQEEIESSGIDLVHMNGRLYDPHLGRFLSPDPMIQDPSNNQCLNRYSYCQNSPENYIDPTGFSFWSSLWKGAKHLFQGMGSAVVSALRNPVVGAIVTIAAAAIAIGTLPQNASLWGLTTLWHFAAAAAVAGAVTYAQTGNLEAGLKSFGFTLLSEYAWGCVGKGLGGKDWEEEHWVQASFAHGVAGADLAVIEGGRFKDGFLAAAVGQACAAPINGLNNNAEDAITIMERGAMSGVVGGTVAASTGGSFENGAMTSAMAQMFNDDGVWDNIKAHYSGETSDDVKNNLAVCVNMTAPEASALIKAGVLTLGMLSNAENDVVNSIVIGENMLDRVIPYAKQIGAEYYTPAEAPEAEWMTNNQNWINKMMDLNYKIIDVGPEPGRVLYPQPTSDFYKMELDEVSKREYQDYTRTNID